MTQANRVVLPACAAAVGAIVTVLDVLDVHSPLRAIAAVLFVVLGPGAAWIGMVRLPDTVTEIAAAIGLSLTAAVTITSVQIYTGTWSPPRTLVYLVALTFLGALLQLAPPDVLGVRDLVSPRSARRAARRRGLAPRAADRRRRAARRRPGRRGRALGRRRTCTSPRRRPCSRACSRSPPTAPTPRSRTRPASSASCSSSCCSRTRALLQVTGAATARLRLLHAACPAARRGHARGRDPAHRQGHRGVSGRSTEEVA